MNNNNFQRNETTFACVCQLRVHRAACRETGVWQTCAIESDSAATEEEKKKKKSSKITETERQITTTATNQQWMNRKVEHPTANCVAFPSPHSKHIFTIPTLCGNIYSFFSLFSFCAGLVCRCSHCYLYLFGLIAVGWNRIWIWILWPRRQHAHCALRTHAAVLHTRAMNQSSDWQLVRIVGIVRLGIFRRKPDIRFNCHRIIPSLPTIASKHTHAIDQMMDNILASDIDLCPFWFDTDISVC